ncbi:protein bric-a-brac 1-like [Amphibalanus amphitrite]|uniref:protein bric-a-brac 1-like n=1 Tax=Amphibalanus amphitrite TaxID=1232801 RepID=UPI001C9173C5|nr:protein bric-a-brac 1-like [Amphibalanus amphitrite]
MGSTQQFSLKWNKYQRNWDNYLSKLLNNHMFSDVMVACDGQVFQLHRIVLASCSSYFEKTLQNIPAKETPIVMLSEITELEMRTLIEFMYCGEATIDQSQLEALLKAAERLQIKGLVKSDADEELSDDAEDRDSAERRRPERPEPEPEEPDGSESGPESPEPAPEPERRRSVLDTPPPPLQPLSAGPQPPPLPHPMGGPLASVGPQALLAEFGREPPVAASPDSCGDGPPPPPPPPVVTLTPQRGEGTDQAGGAAGRPPPPLLPYTSPQNGHGHFFMPGMGGDTPTSLGVSKRNTPDSPHVLAALQQISAGLITVAEASIQYDIPIPTLYVNMRRQGVKARGRVGMAGKRKPRGVMSAEMRDALEEIRAGTITASKASRKYNITLPRLVSWMRKTGVKSAYAKGPMAMQAASVAPPAVPVPIPSPVPEMRLA